MSSEITALTLDPDNPCSTTIRDADGQAVYVVHTNTGKKRSTTTVYDATENVVATCTWGIDDHSAVTSWKGGEEMPMARWMKKSLMPFVRDVSFTDDQGRKYKWKGNEPGVGISLKLYTSEDDYKEAIAGFEKPLLKTSEGDSTEPRKTPARILFTPRALEIRDLAVASFLFLERAIRRAPGRLYGSAFSGGLA